MKSPALAVALAVPLALLSSPSLAAVTAPPAGATVINFDDMVGAPTLFADAYPLLSRYKADEVTFRGATSDGGAILNQSTFGVTGASAPNILGFNSLHFDPMKSGGYPEPPEELDFQRPVKHVQVNVASAASGDLTLSAYDDEDDLIATATVTLSAAMQTVAIDKPGIFRVEIDSTALYFAVDDLAFVPDTVLINFDDLVAPVHFADAYPLSDEYSDKEVLFEGYHENAGAVLNQDAGFGVDGYSPPNALMFNSGLVGTMKNGGLPVLPELVLFKRPVRWVRVKLGDSFGESVHVRVDNATLTSGDATDVVLSSDMTSVAFKSPGMTSMTIEGDVTYLIVDDLEFEYEDPCAHDICYQGAALDGNCDSCAAMVCNNRPSCCTTTWDATCAHLVDTKCIHYCAPLCGDYNDDRKVTASDALGILKAAVARTSCPVVACDFNNDTKITSGDALGVLKLAVGAPVTGKCPAPA